MEKERLYLKPDLSLWELSRAAGYSLPATSKSINSYMGKSFFNLLCGLRLEEAKRLLREMAESGAKMNIDGSERKAVFVRAPHFSPNSLSSKK